MDHKQNAGYNLDEVKKTHIFDNDKLSLELKYLLKEMSEDFMERICKQALTLAEHRGSEKLEEKDIVLAISLSKQSYVDH